MFLNRLKLFFKQTFEKIHLPLTGSMSGLHHLFTIAGYSLRHCQVYHWSNIPGQSLFLSPQENPSYFQPYNSTNTQSVLLKTSRLGINQTLKTINISQFRFKFYLVWILKKFGNIFTLQYLEPQCPTAPIEWSYLVRKKQLLFNFFLIVMTQCSPRTALHENIFKCISPTTHSTRFSSVISENIEIGVSGKQCLGHLG